MRCDIMKNTYFLQNAKDAEGNPLEVLRKQLATNEKFYVYVLATYSGDNDQNNFLHVFGIYEIVTGKTCHLLDWLDELLPENK